MKRHLLLTIAVLGMHGDVSAQTNYYALVTNLWHQGAHTTVVELAQQRLSANPNDIAGLITICGYDLEYGCDAAYSNIVPHVLSVASNITTSTFSSDLDFLTMDLLHSLDFLTIYHPTEEERQEDLRKAALPGQFFIYEEPLRLLDQDGYFANDPPIQQPLSPSPEEIPGGEDE